MRDDGFVYVIITKDLRIKVGKTWRLDLRFKQLKKYLKCDFYHYGHYKSDDISCLEYKILKKIRNYLNMRGTGEIFNYSPEVLKLAVSEQGFENGEDYGVICGY